MYRRRYIKKKLKFFYFFVLIILLSKIRNIYGDQNKGRTKHFELYFEEKK